MEWNIRVLKQMSIHENNIPNIVNLLTMFLYLSFQIMIASWSTKIRNT